MRLAHAMNGALALLVSVATAVGIAGYAEVSDLLSGVQLSQRAAAVSSETKEIAVAIESFRSKPSEAARTAVSDRLSALNASIDKLRDDGLSDAVATELARSLSNYENAFSDFAARTDDAAAALSSVQAAHQALTEVVEGEGENVANAIAAAEQTAAEAGASQESALSNSLTFTEVLVAVSRMRQATETLASTGEEGDFRTATAMATTIDESIAKLAETDPELVKERRFKVFAKWFKTFKKVVDKLGAAGQDESKLAKLSKMLEMVSTPLQSEADRLGGDLQEALHKALEAAERERAALLGLERRASTVNALQQHVRTVASTIDALGDADQAGFGAVDARMSAVIAYLEEDAAKMDVASSAETLTTSIDGFKEAWGPAVAAARASASQETAMVAANDEANAIVGDLTRRVERETADMMSRFMGYFVIGAAAAIVLALVAAICVYMFVTRPFSAITRSIKRLASGELDAPVTRLRSAREFAQVSEAAEVLRKSSLERIELERGLAEAERKRLEEAETVRKMAFEELNTVFGAVVVKAVDGDFSARVTSAFDDPELKELATKLNRIMEIVEEGVRETSRVMAKLSHGDLNERVRGAFAGAFADLQRDVNITVDQLEHVVVQIDDATGTIAGETDQIASAASTIASSMEVQAASLEESAAAMEQMASTIRANVDNAENLASLAQQASAHATSGGDVIANAVVAMTEITQSTDRVAEIVGVIDAIAFQTNLLALNASIESARAGESGKGFAVVATEVRALAERSSKSAEEIRHLIAESAETVARGVKFVSAAEKALSELTAATAQVTTTSVEIVDASAQQSAGVEVVSSTVSHLDTITQENSAMAVSSASAAKQLREHAETLRRLVSYFNAKSSKTDELAA